MTTATLVPPSVSAAADLSRRRLEDRHTYLNGVSRALRLQADTALLSTGQVPDELLRTIEDFDLAIARLEQRIDDLYT